MLRRGSVALIPFPFTDLSASKRRPVLLLTNPDLVDDFVALAITSRPQISHAIPILASDLAGAALPVSSWIRTNRIVTLNTGIVAKMFGQVSDDILNRSVEAVCAYLRALQDSA